MELSINAQALRGRCRRRPTLTSHQRMPPLATVVPVRSRPASLRLEVAAGSGRRRRQRRRAEREYGEPTTIDSIHFSTDTGLVSQPLPTGAAVAIPVRQHPSTSADKGWCWASDAGREGIGTRVYPIGPSHASTSIRVDTRCRWRCGELMDRLGFSVRDHAFTGVDVAATPRAA